MNPTPLSRFVILSPFHLYVFLNLLPWSQCHLLSRCNDASLQQKTISIFNLRISSTPPFHHNVCLMHVPVALCFCVLRPPAPTPLALPLITRSISHFVCQESVLVRICVPVCTCVRRSYRKEQPVTKVRSRNRLLWYGSWQLHLVHSVSWTRIGVQVNYYRHLNSFCIRKSIF